MKINEIFYHNGFTSAWLNNEGTFTVEFIEDYQVKRINYNTIEEVYNNH